MLVEAREQTGQIVEISTHHVWRTVARHLRDNLFELQQTGCQLCFALFANHDLCINRIGINACLAEYGEHAGIGVLHVRRRVAFKRQHVVPVEDVVGGAAF